MISLLLEADPVIAITAQNITKPIKNTTKKKTTTNPQVFKNMCSSDVSTPHTTSLTPKTNHPSKIFLGVLAILFPPIAVWIKCGICSADSLINILLCMLGYVPGLLHAWYIIAKFPDPSDYEVIPQDAESAHVTYIYVRGPDGQERRQQRSAVAPKNTRVQSQAQGGYGSTAPPVAPQPHQESNGTWSEPNGAGEGSVGGAVPPSYEQAISGDHKVQTR